MHERLLRYPGSSTRVSCSDPGDLRWLIEFLRPSFWTRKTGAAEWTISLVRDSAAWHRLRDRATPGRSRTRSVFYLDTRIEKLPILFDEGLRVVFRDRASDAVCEVDSSARTVHVTARSRRWVARLTLMRFVRERAMQATVAGPRLILHAAGFVSNGGAVLLAGQKRSGKSSLLLHSLAPNPCARGTAESDASVSYLANDRVVVDLPSGRSDIATARGLPTIASLRANGLDLFPHVRGRLVESGHFPVLTLAEARRRRLGLTRPWRGRSFTLSPSQLCDLTGVGPRASAPVRAIVFPRVTPTENGLHVTRLDTRAAAAALERGLFRADHGAQVGTLFRESGSPGPFRGRARAAALESLAGAVPCYSCSLGSGAYAGDDWYRFLSGLESARS